MKRALASLLMLSAAACGSGDAPERREVADAPKAVLEAPQTKSGLTVESDYGTPVKDRSATLGLLNKRNNLTQDIVLKSGESKQIGNVIVKLATCERTLPWEQPEEEGAFVQVLVLERESADQDETWRKVFSGWLFRNSPSLNVVEHPVYDVWVKHCAMNFPGEEPRPAPSASPSSAAKPAATPSPSPSATPAPTPTASASASPAAE
jgi:hypothetical protein